MFPYHDENETSRPAYVTMAIIAINVLVWLFVQGAGTPRALAASVCNLGLIPAELTQSVRPGTAFPMGEGMSCPNRSRPRILARAHLDVPARVLDAPARQHVVSLAVREQHRGLDDPWAIRRLLLRFAGFAAAFLQTFVNPNSIVPMVGASGAISGVMGAYSCVYPRVRVFTMVPLGFFITTVALPAWVMLLYWAFLQFASGLLSSTVESQGGVAFWAHVGGFLAGIVLVKVFQRSDYVDARRANPGVRDASRWE